MERLRILSRALLPLTLVLAAFPAACRTPRSGEDSLSTLREVGEDKVSACSPKRSILDPKEGFDFSARNLSLRDAYWLALLAADAYTKKDVVLPELKRLGFQEASFFDEDQVSKNFLNTGLDFPWASTQGFWAEAPGGVVLSFRGSFPGELADLVSDAWSTPSRLEIIGSQIVGTITDTAAAAAAQLPGATVKLEAGENVLVHKGFWNALLIVWKHLEAKATKLYAAERPKERAAKMALLDGWAKTLRDKGQAAALQAVRLETDWRIDEAGKLNFLKQWNLTTTDKKRLDLFEFLDANWASKQRPIFITGHSLGGALATLTAYRLMKMGLNVRGLYTYGAPRVGNQAFVHEFRVLAWQKGLKSRGTLAASGNGGMQRFVHHLDVVTRVPPALGFVAGLSPEDQAEEASGWAHVSAMNYIPSATESKQLVLWREGDAEFEDHFEGTTIPRFVSTLPVEKWREWGSDHATTHYIPKLEQLAFGKATPCK